MSEVSELYQRTAAELKRIRASIIYFNNLRNELFPLSGLDSPGIVIPNERMSGIVLVNESYKY